MLGETFAADHVVRNIDPHLVNKPDRADRHAEFHEGPVYILDRVALLEEFQGIHEVGEEDRVHHKSGIVLAHDGSLSNARGEAHKVVRGLSRGSLATVNSSLFRKSSILNMLTTVLNILLFPG